MGRSRLLAEIHGGLVELRLERAHMKRAQNGPVSDRAVRILQATDAGDILPRAAQSRVFFECRFCAYADRCWRQGQ